MAAAAPVPLDDILAPRTVAVFALHRALQHAPPEEQPALMRAIQAARNAFADGESNTMHEHVMTVWRALAALPADHPLHLPPLYPDKHVSSALHRLIHVFSALPELTTSGGTVLQGVVGVGKTTMLTAAHIIGPLVFDVLCVFWDFSPSSSGCNHLPLDIASAALNCALQETPVSVLPSAAGASPCVRGNVLHAAFRKARAWRGLVFLGDEVSTLFLGREAATRRHCIHIVEELAHIAKHHGWAAVLTGSASKLGSMLFNHGEGVWGTDTGAGRYPDLNDGVYTLMHVPPMRDPGTVLEYTRVRYPEWRTDLSGEDIFNRTGGVGRRIEDLHSCTTGADMLTAKACKKVEVAMREDPAFKALCALLLLQGGGEGSWHARLRDAKGIRGSDLSAWQDRSLVFVNYTRSRVELLFPCALRAIQAFMQQAEARQDFCWSVALRLWDSGDVFKEAEVYTLAKLGSDVAEKPFANVELRQSVPSGAVTLHRKTKRIEWCAIAIDPAREGATLGTPAAADDAAGMVCTAELAEYGIVQLASEPGVDGFWITPAGEDVYEVHFAQVKLGYQKRSDTGELMKHELAAHKVATARKQAWVVRDGVRIARASSAKGNSVAGILAKGEIGVDRVFTLLRRVYRGTTFHAGSFFLFTSKYLNEAAMSVATDTSLGCPGGECPTYTNFTNQDWAIAGMIVVCDDAFRDQMWADGDGYLRDLGI